MINSKKWINTLPFANDVEVNQEKYNLNPDKWVDTLPETKVNNPIKKYSLAAILFIVGLMSVSVIKNETRNLQKEINSLRASINILGFDLHQTTLEHEFITSPENISKLAKEYLEPDLVAYKKSQIRQLGKKEENVLTELKKTGDKKTLEKKNEELKKEIKIQLAKKIEKKKAELKKLQEFYHEPKKLPGEIKLRVVKRIEKKKTELKELVYSPKEAIDLPRIQKWAGIQIVKAFLGIPIVPGK